MFRVESRSVRKLLDHWPGQHSDQTGGRSVVEGVTCNLHKHLYRRVGHRPTFRLVGGLACQSSGSVRKLLDQWPGEHLD